MKEIKKLTKEMLKITKSMQQKIERMEKRLGLTLDTSEIKNKEVGE